MSAGAGRGEAPGWGFSSALGLSFLGRLCPSTPLHGHEDSHPGTPQDSAIPHISPTLAQTGSSP